MGRRERGGCGGGEGEWQQEREGGRQDEDKTVKRHGVRTGRWKRERKLGGE